VEVRRIADEWVSSDLTDINYNPAKGIAELVWFDLDTQEWVTAKADGVLFFKVSNAPDDWEPTFVVDVSIQVLSKKVAMQNLRKIGYGFVETEPLPNLKHLHAEGSVVIDLVSEKIELRQSISKS